MRRSVLCSLAALLLAAGVPARLAAQGTRVTGVVLDSLLGRGAPLGGAEVLLEGSDATRTGTTGADGRFALPAVPAGRYRLTIFHQALEALGVGAPVVAVDVPEAPAHDLVYSLPSPAAVSAALCGSPVAPGRGVVLARLRPDSGGAPRGPARLRAEWVELTFGAGGPAREPRHVDAITGGDGAARLCNVPTDVELLVTARGVDDLPGARPDAALRMALGAVPLRLVELQPGRRDTVGTAGPAGGYGLDPVMVTARRNARLEAVGFDRRRRTGRGTFVTLAEIEARRPLTVSELLNQATGFYVRNDTIYTARPGLALSPTATAQCLPQLIVDGTPFGTAGALRYQVAPEDVLAIEAYSSPANIPIELDATGRSRCGMVVVWTKRGRDKG